MEKVLSQDLSHLVRCVSASQPPRRNASETLDPFETPGIALLELVPRDKQLRKLLSEAVPGPPPDSELVRIERGSRVTLDWFPVRYETFVNLAESDRPEGEFHQGERATALTLAASPELIDMSRAEAVYSSEDEGKKLAYGRGVNMAFLVDYDMHKVTPQGHIGNAKAATRELGEALYEEEAEFIAKFIKPVFK